MSAAGQLREQITIEALSKTKTPAGVIKKQWGSTDYSPLDAQVIPLRQASLSDVEGRVIYRQQAKVVVRWVDGLLTRSYDTFRILYRGKHYILTYPPAARGKSYIEFVMREVLP